MYCEKCGKALAAGSHFCEFCGAVVAAHIAPQPQRVEPDPERAFQQATRLVSPGVTLGLDGVLRWVYELNMWRNPTVLITVWKVLLLSALAPALLVAVLAVFDGDGISAALGIFWQIFGLLAAVVTGLMLLAYPLVAIINGGKYCVIFEMDASGIRHIQMQSQSQRNQVLAAITLLAGAMSGSAQAAGAGVLAGARKSMYTAFRDVRSVRVIEKRHVIYLASKLAQNQVYAEPADFAFVLQHITAHCKPSVRRAMRQGEAAELPAQPNQEPPSA